MPGDRFQLCPHCDFQSQFSDSTFQFLNGEPLLRLTGPSWPDMMLRALVCRHCSGLMLDVQRLVPLSDASAAKEPHYVTERIYPWKPNPPKLSDDVPQELRGAYAEAWALQGMSERASAVMARRCLQLTLRKQGYVKKTLDAEINAAEKNVGPDLATQLHYVRTLGNIGAHPMDAEGGVSFDELLDVQPGELMALFAAIREAFDEFFVKPARKSRDLDALNARLKAAGKPTL